MNYGAVQIMHFPDGGVGGYEGASGASLRSLGRSGGGGSSASSLFFSPYSFSPQQSESFLERIASWNVTGNPSMDAIINIALVIIVKTWPIWYRLIRLFFALSVSYWCVAGVKPVLSIFGYIWTFITANVVIFYPIFMLTCIWGYSLTTNVVLILNGLGSTLGFNIEHYLPKWIGGNQAYKRFKHIIGLARSARSSVGVGSDDMTTNNSPSSTL